MKTLTDIGSRQIIELLQRIDLGFEIIGHEEKIPGSFWGEPEAGLIQNTLYARSDTPIHSILHETCHYICMTPERRATLHTNALGNSKGNFVEEHAVCFLQILLADELEGFTRQQIFIDMDDWGYSFRLGSSREWFEKDSDDAHVWLMDHDLVDRNKHFKFCLRQ